MCTVESHAIGVRRVRLSRILSVAGFGGLMAAFLTAVVLMGRVVRFEVLLVFLSYLFWLVPWTASYVVWFLEPKRPGRITIERDAVHVARGRSSRVVPRSEIASAQSVVRADGTRVEVELRKGDVLSVAVGSVAEADSVVSALGFGAGGVRQTIDLGARRRRFVHLGIGLLAYQATVLGAMPFMVLTMFLGAGAGFPVVMGLVGLALPLVYRWFRARAAAPRLEIGDDGLALFVGAKPARFFPRGAVYGTHVVPGSGRILITTAEGPIAVSGMALDESMARSAVHTIERRWSATAAARGARLGAFARSGRPVDAWRAELASRISSAGYRGDGLTVEEADAVIRNPRAPADARVGAALALAAVGERVRIADAAAPVADRRLRIALEAVAEGREDRTILEEATSAKEALRR